MKCRLFSIALVLALSCATVFGQGTAQISGTVADTTGALLPGVDITATQTETGAARSAVSNETGAYTMPNLPIGPYRLEVSLPGFQTYVQTGITLAVNTSPVINVRLQVGQVAQTIEVTANAALVETRSVGVGQIMESERILELPLNGRNVTELIVLSGAAVSTGVSSPRSMPGQQEISVAGSQGGSVGYMLDGAPHNNAYDNLSLPLPFPDALGEFKVETSALQASQGGRFSGAQVGAVTRSGTNEFHGSAFWFVRNDLFGARRYTAETNSTLKRNQFGGTIGGPIAQNKLFFFAGYQGTTNREDPGDDEAWIPTQYALTTGDWSRMVAPGCAPPTRVRNNNNQLYGTVKNAASGAATGFVNNQVDPSLYHPVAMKLAQALPLDRADDCGRVQYGYIHQNNDWQLVSRTDYQMNDAHSVMGRVLYTSTEQQPPYLVDPSNLLLNDDRGWDNLASSYALGDTWLIDPTTVLSTRVAVNYTDVKRTAGRWFDWTDLGVQDHFTYVDNYMRTSVTNGFTLGGCTANPSPFKTFSAGLNSDLSLSRGDHQWGVGGSLSRIDSNGYANCDSTGTFNFNGERTGYGLADMMLGLTNNFTEATPNTDLMKKWVAGMYLSDTWRVRGNVTMSYGMRWEPDLPETITNQRIVKFSEDRFQSKTYSEQFNNAPAGFYYTGDTGFQGDYDHPSGRDTHWANFAPRLGLAWDVFGDGRTSVRASGGIGYDYPDAQFHLWTSLTPPYGANVDIAEAPLSNPWIGWPSGPGFPADPYDPDLPFPTFGQMTSIGDNFQASQNQSWNLALQQQVGNDWLVSASYIGNHTIRMVQGRPVNPALFFPGVADASGVCTTTVPGGDLLFPAGTYTLTGLRAGATCSTRNAAAITGTDYRRRMYLLDPANGIKVGPMSNTVSEGTSNYHGLLLTVRSRRASGVNVNSNYTWSHCISPLQGNGFGGTGFNSGDVYPDWNNRDETRANCTQDRRHNLNLTVVADSPEFQNGTLRAIASDWSLSTIYRINSGTYMTVSPQEADVDRNGLGNDVANYDGSAVYTGNTGPDALYLNTAAFSDPTIGSRGNLGIRNMKGPAQWDFDGSLRRTFAVGETQTLEFRTEAYNLTNSFRPSNPNSTVGNTFFGVTRGQNSRDPRILQFALKLNF